MLPIDLTGKVAVVTGATQGIGLGVARMLAKAGCDIAGCGLKKEDNPMVFDFKNMVKAQDRRAYYQSIDVVNENQINTFVENVIAHFGRIDILVSNAGQNMFTSPNMCDTQFWDNNANLNLKSHWMMAKACYPQLSKNNGSVILMSSNHAYATLPNCFPYNVTKAGLIGLVNALAVDWGGKVRVVGLAPGFIDTKGGDKWFNSFPNPEAKRKEVINIHPVKKIGTVDEIGAFCAFLTCEYAGFITGTTYLVDGGRSSIMQDI